MSPAYELLCKLFASSSFRIQNGMPAKENLNGLFKLSSLDGNAFHKYWGNLTVSQGRAYAGEQEDLVLLLNHVVSELESGETSP